MIDKLLAILITSIAITIATYIIAAIRLGYRRVRIKHLSGTYPIQSVDPPLHCLKYGDFVVVKNNDNTTSNCKYLGLQNDGTSNKHYIELIKGPSFDGETYKFVGTDYLSSKLEKIYTPLITKWER